MTPSTDAVPARWSRKLWVQEERARFGQNSFIFLTRKYEIVRELLTSSFYTDEGCAQKVPWETGVGIHLLYEGNKI